MHVVISGPRRLPSKDPRDPWPYLHVELDMPELPAVGERITLNGGSSFTVRRRFFYVESPQNEAYYSYNAEYETDEGVYDTVYLDVLPSDYDEPFTYDQAVTEGTQHGHEQAAAEVEKLLDLASAPGVDPGSVVAMLREWCREDAEKARERAAQAERHRALAERIMTELQERRENS